MPTFDVLMPVLNAVQFLGEAIDSLRNQTFSDWRLLILDHGSRDGSTELAHRYAESDNRIRIFSFPKADGLAELRNLGLDKCDCKYVLCQDADDISLPNRMSIVNDLFRGNPNFLVIGGDAFIIDKSGRQIGYAHLPISSRAITPASFFYNPMAHSTIAAKFIALERHGARYGKDILNLLPAADSLTVRQQAEDYFLFGQMALLGLCANAGVPLVKYRRHGAGVGTSNPVQQIETALKVSRFLARSFCVMKNVQAFDPGPFCNHWDHIFDFQLKDYAAQFEQMAAALRRSLGQSSELERELAFRRVLATRNSGQMAARYLQFSLTYAASRRERRTVRNWLLRNVRGGKGVYRAKGETATSEGRMSPSFNPE